jgi:hypothetical protein
MPYSAEGPLGQCDQPHVTLDDGADAVPRPSGDLEPRASQRAGHRQRRQRLDLPRRAEPGFDLRLCRAALEQAELVGIDLRQGEGREEQEREQGQGTHTNLLAKQLAEGAVGHLASHAAANAATNPTALDGIDVAQEASEGVEK